MCAYALQVRERSVFSALPETAGGKLFQVETEYFAGQETGSIAVRRARTTRRVEHFWLCDACSPYLTLTVDRQRGVVTVPLPDGLGQKTVRVLALDTPGQAVESSTYQHGLHEVQK